MFHSTDISDLMELYRTAKKRFDDDEEFKTRSREAVTALQSGDPDSIKVCLDLKHQSWCWCCFPFIGTGPAPMIFVCAVLEQSRLCGLFSHLEHC